MKKEEKRNEAVKKGFLVAGIKVIDTLLKGILHKSQGKDPLDEAVKELQKGDWLIIHKKPKFIGISLNTVYKKEIIEFIEQKMPHLKGAVT